MQDGRSLERATKREGRSYKVLQVRSIERRGVDPPNLHPGAWACPPPQNLQPEGMDPPPHLQLLPVVCLG